jgi:hypothetical protein
MCSSLLGATMAEHSNEGAWPMRTLASHMAVFVIGAVLATAAGATAHPPKQSSLATRLTRLEVRHDLLQSNYQTFCNTLKHTSVNKIQDLQVRDMFIHLATTCWTQ